VRPDPSVRLSQLKQRANAGQFAGHIVAIVKYADEVELLRGLGADEVFLVDVEAGIALADDAVAGWQGKQARTPQTQGLPAVASLGPVPATHG